MKYILIGLVLFLSACNSDLPSHTVMITNLNGNSGGSGTVIYSDEVKSLVLTNGHVCGVVKNGGVIIGAEGKAAVVSYKISQLHDLCVIQTSAVVGEAARLNKFIPRPFDDATTIGHPHLMPTIITKGHLAGHQTIQVMIGARDCTEAEKNDQGGAGMFCALFGKLPLVKNYDAVATSTLIQPGSSGSAVYSEAGTIEAVIFAGSGDIGFGYAVPFEYIYTFLHDELKSLPSLHPDSTLMFANSVTSNRELIQKMIDKCVNDERLKDNHLCHQVVSSKSTLEF